MAPVIAAGILFIKIVSFFVTASRGMEIHFGQNQDQNDSTIPVDRLIACIESVLNRLAAAPAKLSKKKPKQPYCHTILCYGHNGVRLRLAEVIFAQRISFRQRHDVHLIRSGHLPDLLHKSVIPTLIPDQTTGHCLSFLKIYYFRDYADIVQGLSSISVSNRRQMLPTAIIVDGMNAYTRMNVDDKDEQPANPDLATKRFRLNIDRSEQEEQIMMRLCSLLQETMEYCAGKLKHHTHLVLCLDLNHHSGFPQPDQSLVAKLIRRYFRESINVDTI